MYKNGNFYQADGTTPIYQKDGTTPQTWENLPIIERDQLELI
jgi:hypothetical protein